MNCIEKTDIPSLKDGYQLYIEDLEDAGRTNGNYPQYAIVYNEEKVVHHWMDRDTDIEEYRKE